MTLRPDFDDQLRAWADLGDDRLPGRFLDAALIQIEASPQRGARPGWLRLPPVNRFAPIAFAATAVVIALLIGIGIFFRSPNVGPPQVPDPTASATGTAASWTATSPMGHDHFAHTATLLSDGRVLVTGGGGDASVASSELFDPDTGAWTATGDMIAGRQLFTATLLEDGRVLVAGGVGEPDEVGLASAELYDPSTGEWTATQAMNEARAGHSATLLPDGRVLVAGGSNGTDRSASVELFDPRTGTWSATGNMGRERSFHAASLLSDGRVLVAGSSGDFADTAELYDPSSGTWAMTGSMSEGRTDVAAVLLPDGTVLVAGGAEAATAEVFDPEAGSWVTTGPMINVRHTHTATLLSDGTVLVTGGDGGFDAADELINLASVEVYHPDRGTWTAISDMLTPRRWHTATLLSDGTVLVAGGADGASSSAEVFQPDVGN